MRQMEIPGATVLIVDDNITNLKVASEHLSLAGFEILTARDGETSIKRAVLSQPDVILLDIQMPGIDGFETCRRLKANPKTADIPVIITTVLTNIEDKVKGFSAGAVDYLAKPFQVEELLARVNTHLTIYRLQRNLQAEIRERQLVEVALRKANLELQRLAVLDELTQIANRRRFDQYLLAQWETHNRQPVSLLLCDVDNFKLFNDNYGHQAGDQCLHTVAQAISRVVGYSKDLVARYGGEEFAVILPETNSPGAWQVAKTIQSEIQKLKLLHGFSKAGEFVTLSIGLATIVPSVNNPTLAKEEPKALIAAADAALYQAKDRGRNRVVIHPSSEVVASGLPWNG